jgi:predicted nucleic acid-binding protein
LPPGHPGDDSARDAFKDTVGSAASRDAGVYIREEVAWILVVDGRRVALNAVYVADKSALARFPVPAVRARLRPLLEDGFLATCAIMDLEVLYSSRNVADFEQVLEERRSLDAVPITPEVMNTAIDLQHQLARIGQHRVRIPDLIISAAALDAGLTVLHYHSDFERIAAAGGAPQEWVVPQGSV